MLLVRFGPDCFGPPLCGRVWKLSSTVEVNNLTLLFDEQFETFKKECGDSHRTLVFGHDAGLLDKVWNPPFIDVMQEAIRAAASEIVSQLEAAVAKHGFPAVSQAMVAGLRLR